MKGFLPSIQSLLPMLTAVTMLGCTDEVAAPTGVDQPFSMYGILNPRLMTQTLLVSPTGQLLEDFPEVIDATVRSTDLETGETVVWRDSVVTGDRGQLDHIFMADFRARFGGSYRIDVVRSDGATSFAELRVPGEVEIEVKSLAMHFLDVRVLGELFHLLKAQVLYTVRYYGDGMSGRSLCETSPAETYSVSYEGDVVKTDRGFGFRVDLSFDHDRILNLFQADHPFSWRPSVNGLALMNVEVRFVVADPGWEPAGGSFDENVLAGPGVMTNVSNGFGFVGGGYNQDRRIYPGKGVIEDTWFFDFLMRPPGDCLNFCSCGLG